MAFPQCVITATADSVIGLVDGGGLLTGQALKGARVTFVTNIPDNELISLDGELHLVGEFEAFFDVDGVLRPVLSPEADGVTLPAEDPEWGFENPLQYTVDFSPVYVRGKRYSIKPWVVNAPLAGLEVDLSTMPRTIGLDQFGIQWGPEPDVRLDEDGKVVFSINGYDIGDPLDLVVTEMGSIDGGTPWDTGDDEIDGGTP